MRNLTLSEMMYTFPLNGFLISGDFQADIESYIEFKHIPSIKQNLDFEGFVFPLLRLSFGKNITVHTLTDGVIEKVKHTKIENMPNEIPNFMKKPFLIESRREKPLYDNVYSIGGFILNNEICLIIKEVENNTPGLFCQHEKASFDGRKIDDLNLIYNRNFTFDPSYVQARSRKDTFAFAIIFSLMLEAEKTPILIETKNDKPDKRAINTNKKLKNDTSWIIKRVYIDKVIRYENTSSESVAYDKTGKTLKNVIVNGFLRKQHYGNENSKEKWIYIESFGSKRWTNEYNTKIIVDVYDKVNN